MNILDKHNPTNIKYIAPIKFFNIIPIIMLNLFLGFVLNGIDNAGHIGGLIGGILLSMACGVQYKSKKQSRFNGINLTLIFTAFLIILLFMA